MKKGKLIFLSVIGLLWIIAFVKVYLFFDKYMNKKADESLSSYEQEPASKREKTAVEEFFFNYIEDLYAEYYDILNIDSGIQDTKILLEANYKAIKKRENILKIIEDLKPRNYPESFNKIKNAIIEDINGD